jgi:hypothetical protein
MYLYVIINSAKRASLYETLAHKLRDRYQLPIKICIYAKSKKFIYTSLAMRNSITKLFINQSFK